jgi:3-oxoacyl-[acyl-carrier protein] reductase
LKAAIVTGGAGGIGKSICLRLARDGFHVAVNYLGNKQSADEIVSEIGKGKTQAIAVQADISSADGATELYAAAVKAFGGVSVLVNNASPDIAAKPFEVMEWSDLQRHLDIQVKGAFLMSKACIPGMVERHDGRIVNITSQAIDGNPSVTWTGYATAKAALAMMSHYLAAEYGPSGITVNCVSPSMTETSLIGNIPEKIQMMVARQTPLRRLALPDDVAAAVAYLISDDSAFVTGHTLRVNGGISMS